MKYDTIVIGGGPGGALSAGILAQKGYKVIVIEAGSKNRYKVCSGGTPLRSIKLLSILGNPLKIVEREIKGVNIFIGENEVISAQKSEVIGYSYYRSELDQWIRDRAQDHGSEVVYNTVAKKIHIDKHGVRVKCDNKGLMKEYEGELLIGAFGIRPDLLMQLGLKPTEYLISLQSEFVGNIENLDESIKYSFNFIVDSRYSSYSYGWIFPKKEGLSIGITDRMEGEKVTLRFKEFLKHNPIVSKQIKELKVLPIYNREFLAHLNPNKPLEKTYGNRFVVIGDAAGFADPVTWEGIYFSLKSGEIAARVFDILLTNKNFSEKGTKLYEKEWKKEFGKIFNIEWAVKQILWGKDLEYKWIKVAKFFKSNKKRYELLQKGLTEHMSIAPVIKQMSILDKLNIGFRIKGYKLLKNPINFIHVFRTLFS